MANLHSNQGGIKLFGKMITLQSRKIKEESEKDEDDKKRPEKIIACPRCKSMDTKFCYFNNYNVNQPRHFCKGCQRYWTAGGALRNVPIGAGRRRMKPPNCIGGDLPEDYELYDGSGGTIYQLGFDGVGGWHVMEKQEEFRRDFHLKRQKIGEHGKTSS